MKLGANYDGVNMVIAYMLTWTTYGTWLQGDRRGWVKNGEILHPDINLETANRRQMKADHVVLTKSQKISVVKAIINEAKELNQKLFALAVCNNHVHLIVKNTNMPIGQTVSHYKNAARLAVEGLGFHGKLWTRGFDKRYCMDEKELAVKIAYVRKHQNANAEIVII